MDQSRKHDRARLTKRQEAFLNAMPSSFPKGYILAFPTNEPDPPGAEDGEATVATHIVVSSNNLLRTWAGLCHFFGELAEDDGEPQARPTPQPHQN